MTAAVWKARAKQVIKIIATQPLILANIVMVIWMACCAVIDFGVSWWMFVQGVVLGLLNLWAAVVCIRMTIEREAAE